MSCHAQEGIKAGSSCKGPGRGTGHLVRVKRLTEWLVLWKELPQRLVTQLGLTLFTYGVCMCACCGLLHVRQVLYHEVTTPGVKAKTLKLSIPLFLRLKKQNLSGSL